MIIIPCPLRGNANLDDSIVGDGRCGWSKANLCVALGSLLETCDAHCEVFRVSNFGGLEVVFGNDPSVLQRGEASVRIQSMYTDI